MTSQQLPLSSLEEAQTRAQETVALTAHSSLHKALEAFHAHMLSQDLSIHTIKAFDSDLRLLSRYLGPRAIIGHISTKQLESFLHYLRHERGVPCKLKSLARRLTTLKVFFSWLTEEGVLSSDPAAPLVHQRVSTPLPRILSEQELAQLLTATEKWRRDPRDPDARPHLLCMLLLSTGIKKSECINIALTDIDTSEPGMPTVLIRYENIRQRYKERKLRLPPQFPTVLSEYIAQYKPQTKLFECTARNLEYVLDECVKRAGLPARSVSFEILRWTCAARDLKAGMDEDLLRRKLGLSRITWADTLDKLKRLTATPL
ncbi:MAG: tyrosine-type recombinase/integrase [Anaerolineae bacterium]